MKDGIDIIKDKLKSIPTSPGVYRMLNSNGDILYIGKAKNLKNRLTNYTQAEGLSNRIRKMVFETAELVIVECSSETESLLLEISLIKSLKPKYNIIFRDDSAYPYILITKQTKNNNSAPRLAYHRGAKRIKGDYFGPYPDAGKVHRTIDMLERTFLLRTCKDSTYNNRSRPCLKYHIKRCSAPCVNKITEENYAELVNQAKDLLNGKSKKVQVKIQKTMEKASNEMRFEDAAIQRDRLQALAAITAKQTTFATNIGDADFLALANEAGKACVQLFSYRGNQHIGNSTHFPNAVNDETEAEILRLFILMHYEKIKAPKSIFTSHDVAEADVINTALKTQISTPRKGDKKTIINQALENAKNKLQHKNLQSQSWKQQLEHFSEVLGAENGISRIETFDISNISGKHSVASLVVAGSEGMLKSDYRKYAIKGKDTPDDYAMMHEVLTRRYDGLLKQSKNTLECWPNVIMVDGGKGHLNILIKVFKELGLEDSGIILCGISKGPERDKGYEKIWQQGKEEPIDVPFNSPLIFILQQIRDESHRFAIGFHRQKRSKTIEKSILDSIPNIGAKRKKALLLAFGSAEGVKTAALEDLAKVEGISKQLAQHIYDWLR